MASDNSVGFGNPPKSGQWKKGQSGNPGGRPKRKADYIADYARILSEPVKAKQIDGSTIALESLEAPYVQLCKKALKGGNAVLFNVIKIMIEILPEGMKAEEEIDNKSRSAKDRFWKMAGWLDEDRTTT